MKSKKKKKRLTRHYLLLEITIGLSLVLLSLFPLVKPLSAMRKQETRELEEMQLKRIAEATFFEVKCLLFEHKIPWESFQEPSPKSIGDPIEIPFGQRYHRFYEIAIIDSHKKENLDEYLLLEIKVALKAGRKAREYLYPLLIQKI